MYRRSFLQGVGSAGGLLLLEACAGCRERASTRSPGRPSPQPAPCRLAVLTDAVYGLHLTGPGHPERPQRLQAVGRGIQAALKRAGQKTLPLKPRECTSAELRACHTRAYLEIVRQDVAKGANRLRTGDTPLGRRSLRVARLAVGGVLTAVDAVVAGRARTAFCSVRPPGHHATPSRGMGFCLFNNVAVAARYAQRRHRLGRVLIVDWDVHHGNGTQDIFYADPTVFYFSTHQSPWYPGTGSAKETGAGKGRGFTLNCPFPAGAGRREILGAFAERLIPAMQRFRPELILVSAGFDSRRDDPLGQFTLTDRDFADLTRVLLQLARDHKAGVVSVLEGGYNLKGLESVTQAHVAALIKGVT